MNMPNKKAVAKIQQLFNISVEIKIIIE